jgi:hypothetical protein
MVMQIFGRIVCFAACLTIGAGAANAADCQYTSSSWSTKSSTTWTLTAKNGVSCPKRVNAYGAPVRAVTIAVPSQHGTATAVGSDTFAYQSGAGYVGPDSFQVSISTGALKPGIVIVDVTVTK